MFEDHWRHIKWKNKETSMKELIRLYLPAFPALNIKFFLSSSGHMRLKSSKIIKSSNYSKQNRMVYVSKTLNGFFGIVHTSSVQCRSLTLIVIIPCLFQKGGEFIYFCNPIRSSESETNIFFCWVRFRTWENENEQTCSKFTFINFLPSF